MSRLRGENNNNNGLKTSTILDGSTTSSATTTTTATPSNNGEDKVIAVNGNFDELIKKYKLVVIDFGAQWCQGCMKLSPTFHQISSSSSNPSDVGFLYVDIDENPDIADRYEIGAIPCFVVVNNNGSVIAQNTIGKESKLIEFVNEHVESYKKDNNVKSE
jgi:thioredoxin-like negative regulator of GroEL